MIVQGGSVNFNVSQKSRTEFASVPTKNSSYMKWIKLSKNTNTFSYYLTLINKPSYICTLNME